MPAPMPAVSAATAGAWSARGSPALCARRSWPADACEGPIAARCPFGPWIE